MNHILGKQHQWAACHALNSSPMMKIDCAFCRLPFAVCHFLLGWNQRVELFGLPANFVWV